jgi:hypothetical protein
MRQCLAVAWEGWTTKAVRGVKLSMGRRTLPGGPLVRVDVWFDVRRPPAVL